MNTVSEIKILIQRNKKRLGIELQESKELVRLLGKSTYNNLTKEEKDRVKKQLIDICKGIPAFTIFMMPGGVLLLPILIKYIPNILPSAFRSSYIESHTYVALLRGINVSGQKIIKMLDLKELFSYSNLENMRTYIQSGNLIFESENENVNEIEEEIYTYIYKEYGYEVPVIVKTLQEWTEIVENNPFIKEKDINLKSLSVTFLSDVPTDENIDIMKSYEFNSEKYIIKDSIIYSVYPNGVGRSKMTNNFFEKKLKVSATSRNWNTVNKLFSIGSNN